MIDDLKAAQPGTRSSAAGNGVTIMMVLDQCEGTLTDQFAMHSVGLLSLAESFVAETVPVPFRTSGSALLCLIPRWSALAAALEGPIEQAVVLAVVESRADGEHWLRCHGLAQPSAATWPGFMPVGAKASNLHDRFLLIQITPMYVETRQPALNRSETTGRDAMVAI
jgi:hypothetical protein